MTPSPSAPTGSDASGPPRIFDPVRREARLRRQVDGDIRPLSRSVIARAAALYAERHGEADGRIPASFEIIHLAGWAPHESQQKPLPRGSAKMRLADALGVKEQSGEEPA